MNKNEIRKIISKTKRKSSFVSIIMIILALGTIVMIDSPIKYLIATLFVIVGVGIILKIYSVSYLLFDECNPQLYYAVEQGIVKQVPLDKQMIVSEFIGDYSSAIQIANSLVADAKSANVKATYIAAISRNAFLAGDYELCKSSIDTFNKVTGTIKKSNIIFKLENVRNDFFLAYINGDYESAKGLLAQLNTLARKQKNSFKCTILYYNATVDYALGRFEEAKAEFSQIIAQFPNMHFATMSQNYLDSKENAVPIEHTQIKEVELPPTTRIEKASKRDWAKVIIAILVVFSIIFVAPKIINMQYKGDTALSAIQKDNESDIVSIEKTIEVDDSHIVCIFKNADDVLGVAYLEKKNENYYCYIQQDFEYLMFEENDDCLSKMHTSGKSQEIVFKWVFDKKFVDEQFTCIELTMNKKPVYFCYYLTPEKQYFANSYSSVFDDSTDKALSL